MCVFRGGGDSRPSYIALSQLMIIVSTAITVGMSMKEVGQAYDSLHPYSHKWRMIGQGLGFTANELELIEATPTLLVGAPRTYLMAMLSSWQQWAPGDHRAAPVMLLWTHSGQQWIKLDWDSLHKNYE